MESTEPNASRILKESSCPCFFSVSNAITSISTRCFNFCVFIGECCNNKEPVKVVELKTPIVDCYPIYEPYTNSHHNSIQMMENPLHI